MKCIFCDRDREILCENNLCYAIYDAFPVSKGHSLIIPKRHVEQFFELTVEEVESMFLMSLKVKSIIDNEFKPDGYNVGFNCGEKAGQTINHCHMHIIPRYEGDVEQPKGGIRGVIPEKQNYGVKRQDNSSIALDI